MKFLCIVTVDDELAEQLSAEDWARISAESQSYDRQLMQRGVFVAAEALLSKETAHTVRVRGDETLIIDGPYTEAKEVVAGFILIDVADEKAALEIAKGIPMAAVGGVEVRPVMQFD